MGEHTVMVTRVSTDAGYGVVAEATGAPAVVFRARRTYTATLNLLLSNVTKLEVSTAFGKRAKSVYADSQRVA
jgi:hypothetical protein